MSTIQEGFGCGYEEFEHPDIWEVTAIQERAFESFRDKMLSKGWELINREYQESGLLKITARKGRNNHWFNINDSAFLII